MVQDREEVHKKDKAQEKKNSLSTPK